MPKIRFPDCIIRCICAVFVILLVVGCNNAEYSTARVSEDSVTVPVPDFLVSAREINVQNLALEVRINGTLATLQPSESANERVVSITVPGNQSFVIDAIWFHEGLEIARLSRTESGVTSNSTIQINNADYNTDADQDQDGASNLREFVNNTDPRNSASSPIMSTRLSRVDISDPDTNANIQFDYLDGRVFRVLGVDERDGTSVIDADHIYNQAGQLAEKKRYDAFGISELDDDTDIGFIANSELSIHRYTYEGALLQSESATVVNQSFASFAVEEDYVVDFIYLGENQIQIADVTLGNGDLLEALLYTYFEGSDLVDTVSVITDADGLLPIEVQFSYDNQNRVSSITAGDLAFRFTYEAGDCDLRLYNDLGLIYPLCYR